jgi:hypothetical protein
MVELVLLELHLRLVVVVPEQWVETHQATR